MLEISNYEYNIHVVQGKGESIRCVSAVRTQILECIQGMMDGNFCNYKSPLLVFCIICEYIVTWGAIRSSRVYFLFLLDFLTYMRYRWYSWVLTVSLKKQFHSVVTSIFAGYFSLVTSTWSLIFGQKLRAYVTSRGSVLFLTSLEHILLCETIIRN